MLTIEKKTQGEKVLITLDGRLDTASAPQLSETLGKSLFRTTELIFDCKKLTYISSAGLRVLLQAQKQMNLQGRMRLVNVGETVMETLEITGFVDIFFIAD